MQKSRIRGNRTGRARAARALVSVCAFALALALAAPARAARVTDVRVGQHDGFSRVVFELDAPAGYKVERQGSPSASELIVSLDAAARPESVRGRLDFIQSVDVKAESARTSTVRIRLKGSNLKLKEMILADPPRIVLDVLGPAPVAQAKPAPTKTAARPVAKPVAKAPEAKPVAKAPEAKPAPAPTATVKPTPAPTPSATTTAAATTTAKVPDANAPSPAARPDANGEKPVTVQGRLVVTSPTPAATPNPTPAATPNPTPAATPNPAAAPTPNPGAAQAGPSAAAAAPGPAAVPTPEAADAMPPRPALPAPKPAETARPVVTPPKAVSPPSRPGMFSMTNIAVGAGGLLLVVGAAVFFLRRRNAAEVVDASAFENPLADGDNPFAGLEGALGGDRPESSAFADSDDVQAITEEIPVREAAKADDDLPLFGTPTQSATQAAGILDELDPTQKPAPKKGNDMDMVSENSQTTRNMGAGPGSSEVTRMIAEFEKRMAAMETRIDELVDAKERLERQVAAQTEELRVQRAAIARTQRAVRNLSRPGEDAPTEPALRDPTRPEGPRS